MRYKIMYGVKDWWIVKVLVVLFAFHSSFLTSSAQTVRNVTVSQGQAFTDHISLDDDATDKDIMVKFVFDEAANQLTVSLISYRNIFVFREDTRFKPTIKGRTIRPDLLPYVVTFDPKEKYRLSKLFRSTVPKPRSQYVFHRWIDYEGLQPAPQEYAMVNDYITQTFDIMNKRSSVVVRLRDVLLMDDVSKKPNKKEYEIRFGRDLYMEYHVDIQRNPCHGLDEEIASATTALEGIQKSYNNLHSKFPNGIATNQESLKLFQDLKDLLVKQFPRKDEQSTCPNLQKALDDYNAYADSIANMKCVLGGSEGGGGAGGSGVNAKSLLSKARQIDAAVARWLLSSDPIERRDIILQCEGTIKEVNASVKSMGVYSAEQRHALSVFREAEQYFRKNCQK